MAEFIQLVIHDGPLPADYLDRPAPDPAQFGLSAEDDGSRDDALLGHNLTVPPYHSDGAALRHPGCGSFRPSARRAAARSPTGVANWY